MSDVYREPTGNYGVATYLDGGEAVDRARKLLAGFGEEADKAIYAAIRRAAAYGERYGASEVQKDYHVKQETFKHYAHTRWHIDSSGGTTQLSVDFFGYHIPLARFDVKYTGEGRIAGHVKRSTPRVEMKNAFAAEMGNGRVGFFERKTDKRLPVRELLGPAIPQMVGANEGLKERIGERLLDTFNKRIDHEVDYRLKKLTGQL